jgi:hypothetical protein
MRPTTKQLAFLRSLAQRTGETFTYPRTRAEASDEIARMLGRPRSTRVERDLDRREIADAMATRPDDAVRVRDDEVDGHGSSARWAADSAPARQRSSVGERVELARYSTSSQERVVFGQRIDGSVRVFDKPADGQGRSFLIERGLTSKTELDALVAEYVEQSVRRDEPAVLVDLERLAAEPADV